MMETNLFEKFVGNIVDISIKATLAIVAIIWGFNMIGGVSL